MKIFRIVGNDLVPLNEPYVFYRGDVYIVETESVFWLWLGSKSYVDDKFAGIWSAKILQEKKKDLKIKTISENEEPEEFKKIISFKITEGDTPRILKKIEKKFEKDYQLLQIKQNDKGEIITTEIPIDYRGFKSDDAFVLDAYNEIFVWIGKDSQVKEKYEAGRITRALETERKRIPLVYVIEQEEEPEGFRDLVYKLALRDGVIELRKTVSEETKKKRKFFWFFTKK
ncbi:MAG: hypothetical protein HGN29_08720 [Asgard group archaeon]|nr:hypothetical protein [Asgard group archaeon]